MCYLDFHILTTLFQSTSFTNFISIRLVIWTEEFRKKINTKKIFSVRNFFSAITNSSLLSEFSEIVSLGGLSNSKGLNLES